MHYRSASSLQLFLTANTIILGGFVRQNNLHLVLNCISDQIRTVYDKAQSFESEEVAAGHLGPDLL